MIAHAVRIMAMVIAALGAAACFPGCSGEDAQPPTLGGQGSVPYSDAGDPQPPCFQWGVRVLDRGGAAVAFTVDRGIVYSLHRSTWRTCASHDPNHYVDADGWVAAENVATHTSSKPFDGLTIDDYYPPTYAHAMASLGSDVYWSDDWSIVRGNNGGGARQLLYAVAGSLPYTETFLSSLTTDGSALYWRDGKQLFRWQEGGTPQALSLGLQATETLAVFSPDVDTVYFGVGSSLRRISTSPGGSVTEIAADTNRKVALIAHNSTRVFWIATNMSSGGEIRAFDKVAGMQPALAVNVAADGLAADDASVYWCTVSQIWKQSLSGGLPAKVADGACSGFQLDSTNVYWIEHGKVVSAPK